MADKVLTAKILLLEPFYGGSHKLLMDKLYRYLEYQFGEQYVHLVTMTGKKWHWRARTSALYFYENIPKNHSFRVIFASSVLSLAELLGLRPDLAPLKKIIYFHENQLIYPVRQFKERDFQYGYNEINTCIVSDLIIFNSEFNRNSFLDSINKFFKTQPDYRPKNLDKLIRPKTTILFFPVSKPMVTIKDYSKPLHIIWSHRWEHDKNPDDFVKIIYRLSDSNCDFRVSMIGEQFKDITEKYEKDKEKLSKHILHWGFINSYQEYLSALSQAHIAVSTANHEFFGVAMLEATLCKCLPLCPNRLVYPEMYTKPCLYDTYDELYSKLEFYSKNIGKIQDAVENLNIDTTVYLDENMLPKYLNAIIS